MSAAGAPALSTVGELVGKEVHEQAVVERTIRATFVATHDSDRPESHLGVTANGCDVVRRWIDYKSMEATSGDEKPTQRTHGVGSKAPSVKRRVEEYVNARVGVVSVVAGRPLNCTDHFAIDGFNDKYVNVCFDNGLA